ncbi:hypothetical protein [Megalodesulfovibrio gigas]|uniref:Uncharacterized protein n=1 Tax=Megalodesulfovibrio gigas (strain ATCC 19364 / DSM 1382 / NCIMB 9332 / VKM B-1759) TaxID=1121448 RepID=T2GCG1_MEGG1|nr:hypothetical protein [Megalodesulfovibrio gigas]AGW13816.1 hypothetical protein DGI_2047 [Megalodesulfovibrio gigas DSM 1382 = ATCC 19364]
MSGRLAVKGDPRAAIRAAIMAHFNANATSPLYVATSGRLAYLHPWQQWATPFVVFSFRVIAPADTFTERMQWAGVLFSAFAAKAGDVEQLVGNVCDLFEGATLSATGIAAFTLQRVDIVETMRDESGLFSGAVELLGMVEQLS